MNIGDAYKHIISSLSGNYDIRESKNVAQIIMEQLTGFSNTERLLNKNNLLSLKDEQHLKKTIKALQKDTPLQYVLQEAWFSGMKFLVDETVLIPRPETEELVEWIVQNSNEVAFNKAGILDMGTGSGCIAISLKKKLAGIPVSALDYQTKIINLAKKNAAANNTKVEFYTKDMLQYEAMKSLPVFDVIVSNPPYVLKKEINEMEKRVWANEPHAALFVPDDDPLIFYKAVINFCKDHLKKDGYLYFEINPDWVDELKLLLQEKGFKKMHFKKDMQGKIRMVQAIKN
ncbi:MAG: peptide chain release factor N(5)-glutamine methyltransferase [Chitinophagaceae bacterium]